MIWKARELSEIWAHERFFDQCIELYLNRLAGAVLTVEQEALAITGEAICAGADRWHKKLGHPS